MSQVSRPSNVLKFDVDGAARVKLGPTGIGRVLWNGEGIVLAKFSKHVGIIETRQKFGHFKSCSNFVPHYMISWRWSHCLNVISWVSSLPVSPWRFQFLFNDIRSLPS